MEPDAPPTLVDNLLDRVEPDQGPRVTFWGAPNFAVALEQLADQRGMELRDCARQFGVIDLPARGCEQGWRYGEQLGFNRKK
jgi:CRISPR-associated endonuclease/helicase Cas3